MKASANPSSFGTQIGVLKMHGINAARGLFAVLLITLVATSASAQSFTWSDSFTKGVTPTVEQCNNWNDFLKGLAGKTFSSVTVSGTYDATGVTITDPETATQLALLLSSAIESTTTGTVGSVTFEGRTWTVSKCLTSICAEGAGVVLGIDGGECTCLTKGYTIRPYTKNWGGINTATCSASPSQTMTVKFNTGVSIIADGPTTICEGEEVTLTAVTDKCEAPYSYLWSTGETTASIKVSKTGSYSVELFGANQCSGISDAVSVTVKANAVDAGADATFCDNPVQLNAIASGETSSVEVSNTCLFDAGGGNCSFTGNLCNDGYEVVSNKFYSGTVTVPQEAGLRFKLYYSTCTDLTKLTFRMNNNIIGSFDETVRTCSCTPELADGPYPRTVNFSFADFEQYWKDGGNEVSIEVATNGDVYVAGIIAEVSNAGFYSWSPVAGLTDPTVANPLASPASPTIYTVSYTAPNGCTATDDVFVDVSCGLNVLCKAVSVAAGDDCLAIVSPEAFLESSDGQGVLTLGISPAGPYQVGETVVELTVTDERGYTGSCTTTVTVTDSTLPVIVEPPPVAVANDPGICGAMIILDVPAASDNCGIKEVVNDYPEAVFPVGTTTVTWTAVDVNGNTQTTTQLVTVSNAAPVINSVTGPLSAVAAGTNATVAVTYTDDNISHATIHWGDGASPTVVSSPGLSFEVSHSYTSAGIYAVTVVMTDMCGSEASTVYESIRVYDPRVGSVSGGGWFESPIGAYIADPTATGKAQFSFGAEYDGYSPVPKGFASFKFKSGNVKFESSEFDLLLIDGLTAHLTGIGTLNGGGGHSILISMVDDDTELPRDKKTKKYVKADRIRVRISDPAGVVIYDTQFGEADNAVAATNISAGSIEINNNDFSSSFEEELSGVSSGEESTSVYPNPFIDYVSVQYVTQSSQNVVLTMMDLAGRVIATASSPVSADGKYTLDVPDRAKKGIYLLVIRQGERLEIFTVAKE